MEDKNKTVRIEVITALALLPLSEKLAATLIKACYDEEILIRQLASSCLIGKLLPRQVPALIKKWSAQDKITATNIMAAVAKLPPRELDSLLAQWLAKQEKDSYLLALHIIGEQANRGYIGHLLAGLITDDPEIKNAARLALAKFPAEEITNQLTKKLAELPASKGSLLKSAVAAIDYKANKEDSPPGLQPRPRFRLLRFSGKD